MTTFFEMVKGSDLAVTGAKQRVQAAEEALKAEQRIQAEQEIHLNHLMSINNIVQRRIDVRHEDIGTPLYNSLQEILHGLTTWKMSETGGDGKVWAGDRLWSRSYDMENTQLDLNVNVYESARLKKFKYLVTVRAWKVDYEYSRYGVQSSRNYNYGERKYGDELPKDVKFKSLEEAEAFAQTWVKRLTEDHADIINRESELVRAAWAQVEHDREALIKLGLLPSNLKECGLCGKPIEKGWNTNLCGDCSKMDFKERMAYRKAQKEEGRA